MKDVVIKKVRPDRDDERPKSNSKHSKSSARQSHKTLPESTLCQSNNVSSIDAATSRICDKQLRLCIEDVQHSVKYESAMVGSMKLSSITTNGAGPFNLLNTESTFRTSTDRSQNNASAYQSNSTPSKWRNGDAKNPKSSILQPSLLKQNGESLAASDKIKTNNYASRATSAAAAAAATTSAIVAATGNAAAIEAASFLKSSSIIKTK